MKRPFSKAQLEAMHPKALVPMITSAYGDPIFPGLTIPIPFSKSCLLVSFVDWDKQEIGVKWYMSEWHAQAAVHEQSLKQFPAWHESNCGSCKEGTYLPLDEPEGK